MSSPFTVKDDLGAELHTSSPRVVVSLKAGRVPPPDDKVPVVFGPPAYGSPNPATLNNRLSPEVTHSPSAEEDAELDYNSMTKAELLELAADRNLDVSDNNNKAEIVTALEASDNK